MLGRIIEIGEMYNNKLVKKLNSGFTPILILVIVLAIAGVGFMAYQSLKITTPSGSKYPNFLPMVTKDDELTPDQAEKILPLPPNPIANWKTYRNEVLNFTVKIPPDWPEPEQLIMGRGTAVQFGEKLYIEQNITGIDTHLATKSKKQMLDGREAIIYIYEEADGGIKYIVVLSLGNNPKSVFFLSYGFEQHSDEISTYGQILSTFRFLSDPQEPLAKEDEFTED